jgi:hypothetical protein
MKRRFFSQNLFEICSERAEFEARSGHVQIVRRAPEPQSRAAQ